METNFKFGDDIGDFQLVGHDNPLGIYPAPVNAELDKKLLDSISEG